MSAPQIGFRANAAITAGQFIQRIANAADGVPEVSAMTDGTIVGGELCVGIALADAAAGEWVEVAGPGEYASVISTGVLTPGTSMRLTADANGQAIAAVDADQVLALYFGHEASVAGGDANIVYVLGSSVTQTPDIFVGSGTVLAAAATVAIAVPAGHTFGVATINTVDATAIYVSSVVVAAGTATVTVPAATANTDVSVITW